MDKISPNQKDSPALEAKLNQIIADEEGYEELVLTPLEQEKFLAKFSLGAFVFSVFYFWFMKDKLLFWISIIIGSFFSPVIIIFSLIAKRRAWQNRNWRSFSQFKTVQEKWDRAAWYGIAVMIILGWLILSAEIKLMKNFLKTNNLKTEDIRQLQQELEGL